MMKKKVVFLLLVFILKGCVSNPKPDLSKANYYSTVEVGDALDVLIYSEEHGVFADNTYHLYLKHDNSSDSLYIGSHDDHERIFVEFITTNTICVSFYDLATNETPTSSQFYFISDYVELEK